MKKLDGVTLLGVDGADIDRLILAAEICLKGFEFAEVKLLSSLPSKNRHVVPIRPLDSIADYSRFMLADLYRYVDTPHVLIIQHDGFILNPDAWIDEFLRYDYIGAPWIMVEWAVEKFGMPESVLGQKLVGNGGFCLRSKRLLELCKELHEEKAFERYDPEDLEICYWQRDKFEKAGMRFPTFDLARQFSYEAENVKEGRIQWDGQFGFHGLKWTDISKWIAKHPEYRADMKKGIIEKVVL